MTARNEPASGDASVEKDAAARREAESAPPTAAGDTSASGAKSEPGETTTRRRRGSRGGRRHRKPAAAPPADTDDASRHEEDKASAPAAPADAPISPNGEGDGTEPATAGEMIVAESPADGESPSSGETPPAKRRRRGSRGGRRRRKPAEAAGGDASLSGAEHETQDVPAEPVGAQDTGETPKEAETLKEAAAEPAATAREAVAAVPEPVAPGTEGSEGQEGSPGAAKRPRRRGRRRDSTASEKKTGSTTTEGTPTTPAATAEADTSGTAASGSEGSSAPPKPDAKPGEGPGDTATGDAVGQAGSGRASRQGSRRRRTPKQREITSEETQEAVVAVEEDDASADARPGKSRRAKAPALVAVEEAEEVEPEDEAQASPATPSSTAEKTRRRDPRRPRAIVRQDEGSGLSAGEPSRRPPVTADLPERKIILVSDDGRELRVALVEDGRLAEIYIERPDKKSYLGDIYQGKVDNVMTGIDAAFVDFGLEKNGFLYVDEVQAGEGERRPRRISDALKRGQQVLVQVTKDPMGSKGARLSTKISLAGRYLVYVPGGSGVGISRRLKQSERDRLRDLAKQLKAKNAGLIVRTIAEGHGLDDLRRDLRYLSRLWSRLKKKTETVKPPGLVHKEVDISIEVARDLFNESCESLIVDDAKRHKAIVSFLDKEAPELLPKVHRHTGAEPLFEAYGIEEQIVRALERRVPLPSGGNLVIDHAEALTVIDVNTGRFAGGKGLEETITHTNLEAAKEVVRQLRLRDIGGIIIIDFIDMARARNRETVLATLEAELETDRTKTYVVELSPLGLVEMTRQNTTDGPRGIMTRACPACSGKGRVSSDETAALGVERRVRALARRSTAKAWLIEVHPAVADRISGQRLKGLEKETGRRIFFEGSGGLPMDAFRIVTEGSLAHVQSQRIPVHEGQEVDVELEFTLTYSPRDAVGYVDGYMVIVEGGRQALGQRRTVRITQTARTGATAAVLKQEGN